MRENLFKAKRKDNGEWVEGFVFGFNRKIYITEMTQTFMTTYYTEESVVDFNMRAYEIDPDTLCKYTRLTDKNKKKIWENDILIGRGNKDDLVRVVFGEFNVIDAETLKVVDRVIGWHTEVIETDALSKCEPFCLPMPLTDSYINRSEYEVTGNIFDNSELLEE